MKNGKRLTALLLSLVLCIYLLPNAALAGTVTEEESNSSSVIEEEESVSILQESVPEADAAEAAAPASEELPEQDASAGIAFAPGVEETAKAMYAAEDGMTEFNTADGIDWSYYSFYNAKNGSFPG